MSTTADIQASNQPARIAVIGSGPAGIYASDLLVKSSLDVQIDLFEKMPAPFGLIRYGVAPDHPRIKGIVKSLHNVMEKNEIRFLGNIEVGRDITVDEMHEYYDAIIFATGATQDKAMGLPGEELDGSFGSAEFVGFYDGNPNFKREWDLSAESVAVIGVGNVSLDVSRILAKTADELLVTEIPDNVYQSLKTNKAKEVHVFGRRGPAQAKYTPKELKELDESPTIEVIVAPEDIDYDAASEAARRETKSVDLVCQTLESYAMREPGDAPHKIYIHFFESPTEIVGEDGNVVAIRTERTQLDGNGNVTGTGEFTDWPVQAVYRAIGYHPQHVNGVPFDEKKSVIPNDGGHVIDSSTGESIPGLYATGWIKRGPIGLIGNTKSDAKDTTTMLVEDYTSGKLTAADKRDPEDIINLLETRGVPVTTWEGWGRLDAAERAAGEEFERERVKIVEWDDMVRHAGPQA
ncbi:FAD-dependent oxidoreductase [Corynebacterium casei]|uniref:FAD-dependent oxidoreductase n=1 Tax=Corynebacterium casei TaxID=160386 RepID=UPI0009D27BB8|nr:FAD-dependent oxidoreductase [Corynebacterium casei]SLM87512.1 Ferredoxin--NADP(+) reductase, actinobacterial (eukaryote-like) type [Corynebacterium casei]HCJ69784.1 pyridine nucleotide-disulfide oxidoreductase [Corynebacterium casei]